MAIVPYVDKKGKTFGLYINEDSGIFYLVRWINGKSVFRSLKTKSPGEAKACLNLKEHEVRNSKPTERTSQKILTDYLAEMIEAKRLGGTKASTLKRVQSIVSKSIEPFWGNLLPSDISPDKVNEFIKWHRRTRPGIQFINVYKYLGNLFSFLNERGLLETSKKPKLEVPKDERKHHDSKKGRIISPDELRRILSVADERLKLQVLLAYHRGMRLMEIGALHVRQIKNEDFGLVIHLDTTETKTGRARNVPVPPEAQKLLADRVAKAHGYLFAKKSNPKEFIPSQMIDKSWRDALKAAGITDRVRFHDLRHTAADNFKKRKMDPIIACEILGMSIRQYQKTYGNLTSRDLMEALKSSRGQK